MKMTNLENYKPHSKLVLTAVLSSGVTAVSSVTYIILCAIALIYRSDCDINKPESLTTSFFWNIVFTSYIQSEDCEPAPWLTDQNVTSQYTVFILLILILSASSVCLVMACILTTVVCNKETAQYVTITVYAYVGFCIASLVVDLTFATHFGMDYIHLGEVLDQNPSDELFATYYGAFALMTISLKGYVTHAINLVFLVLLVIYAVENYNQRKDEHSIHKMGALNAFESGRKPEDNWSHHPNYPPFTRSSHINNGFINDEERPRSPVREIAQPEYLSNRSFDRSDSWHHSRAPRDPGQNGRPFSYLEDIKRPVPVRPPASPSVDPHWRRDQWPPVAGPPVPVPDYSPQTPRRLKSALKSGY